MSFESHEEFLEAGLFSSGFSTPVVNAENTLFILAADNSLNDEAGGLVSAGLVKGSWVQMDGFANSENNTIGKIINLLKGHKLT